jgi:hypothetical protein
MAGHWSGSGVVAISTTTLTIDPPVAPPPQDPAAPPETAQPTIEVPVAPAPAEGDLPRLVARESFAVRALVALLAVILIGLFFGNAWAYFVPAHPGTDQNGYLVGGKLLAQTLTMRLTPVIPGSTVITASNIDSHQFVGGMWVGTDYGKVTESYYPKYPLGLPLLVATALWTGGPALGPIIAYGINPVAMTLAVLATFLLARKLLRPAFAILATAVFATSPVTLGLTTNPNSHATAVCCVSWGMLLLVDWWQKRGAWRAIVAGLLLGYAATIRYSEGALILPICFVAFMNLRKHWRIARTWHEAGWLLFCWAIPIVGLLAYNRAALGAWTGYGPTNESTGFSFAYAADNWETLIRHLNTNGLSLLLPLAVGGIVVMFWWSWRGATLLVLWTVPCLLTYLFYYWAPDIATPTQVAIGYLRFFLTILPALAISAFWLAQLCVDHLPRPALATIATGILAAVTIVTHLQNALQLIENDQMMRLALRTTADEILSSAPAGAVLLINEQPLLHHLQFAGDYTLYAPQTFSRPFIQSLASAEAPGEPQALDPARREALYEKLKNKDQKQLDDDERALITRALDNNLRVFALLPRRENDPPARRRRNLDAARRIRFVPDQAVARVITPDKFETEVVAAWNNIVPRVIDTPRTRGPRPVRALPARGLAPSYQLVEITKKPYEPSPPPIPRPPAKPQAKPPTTNPTTRPK